MPPNAKQLCFERPQTLTRIPLYILPIQGKENINPAVQKPDPVAIKSLSESVKNELQVRFINAFTILNALPPVIFLKHYASGVHNIRKMLKIFDFHFIYDFLLDLTLVIFMLLRLMCALQL